MGLKTIVRKEARQHPNSKPSNKGPRFMVMVACLYSYFISFSHFILKILLKIGAKFALFVKNHNREKNRWPGGESSISGICR